MNRNKRVWLLSFFIFGSLMTRIMADEPPKIIPPQLNLQKPAQQAATIPPEDFIATLKKAGVSYQITNGTLEINVDQKTALDNVSSLQLVDAIDPNITQDEVNTHPITYSGTIALYYTAQILINVYKIPTNNDLHINIYLLTPNDFGNKDKHLIISFDFNRELFQKINWPNFPAQNLEKVTNNFKFDQWYNDKIKAE